MQLSFEIQLAQSLIVSFELVQKAAVENSSFNKSFFTLWALFSVFYYWHKKHGEVFKNVFSDFLFDGNVA